MIPSQELEELSEQITSKNSSEYKKEQQMILLLYDKFENQVIFNILQAVNALLVHKDQRIDIIKIYIETSHELILNTLRTYFKKNQENLEV